MRIDLSIETAHAPDGLEALIGSVGAACCAVEGVSGMGAAGRIVDDRAIRQINREYRGIDRVTDVLSFPSITYAPGKTARESARRLRREYDPEAGCVHLGDFVISLSRAQAQAEAYGHSLRRELGYLSAHSMFHLMGYDHEDDAQRTVMRALEERAMARVCLPREECFMTDHELFQAACNALQSAYVPYSHFPVGACLLSQDGRTFLGCNVENASFGATICAERGALMNAVLSGAQSFSAIAVAGAQVDAWPCGICRQMLSEFSPNMRVLCGNVQSGTFTELPLSTLLPTAFGQEELAKGRT